MKLRVRINKQTSRVELEEAEPTLTELSIQVKEVLLPSIGFSADTEFSLSLNGKESLVDTGQTLSSCGVVSGDMISVILPQSIADSAPPQPSTSQTHNRATDQLNKQQSQSHTVSAMQSSSQVAGSSNSSSSSSSNSSSSSIHKGRDSTYKPEAKERMEKGENEEEAVGPFVPEPMLCCEAEEGKVPHSLEMLFQAAQCHSPTDCLLVAAHLLLLETGFLPQGGDVRAGEMPGGWRTAGGVYRLQYTHPHCENCLASVVAVPMGQTLVINVVLKTSSALESTRKLVLKPEAYVTEEWAGGQAGTAYRELQKLSRVFKDQLAYPLIATAREALGLPALFGLAVLPPELLLRILRLLDAHSVLSVSAVCTQLQSATQDPILWRHLLHRDFRVCVRPDSEQRDTDWKELYKKRYKQKKDLSRCRMRCYPYIIEPIFPLAPAPTPPVPFPLHPPGIIGGEYDERISIPQGIFPRPRYDPIGPLPGHEPGVGIPMGRRSHRPSGIRPADIRRGFI
ncbi:F-box only protein 7 [Astyanax mexicanus]|uniref:F-box only protein 7 n=1 Tax=Astyanax mexicanus TaxID=7994 RepID=UPI0020CB46E1|nr:F-box only protein 7 [Astyanax mexicanus]